METSLHRQLKEHYAGKHARCEVPVEGYRVDAVRGRRLFEIQHGALGAIRDKIRTLLEAHTVVVVKPIVAAKLLVKLAEQGGAEVKRRMSPKRGQVLDLFDELVHFTRVFPHPRLTLEVPLVEVEERRYPGHGRRRRWREADHQVEDQLLLAVRETHHFHSIADLTALLPADLPNPFHTGDLAAALGVPRFRAQRIAYCLLHMQAARLVGKQGNARLYEFLPHCRPTRMGRSASA
jgi:hypothetical protein